MKKYNPNTSERKWQKEWKKQELYSAVDTVEGKQNYLLLTEFPYPSGNLHIGHWYAFALPDMRARYLKMKGYNVMYPIGFDAFGLPAENAAIKHNVSPDDWTKQNIAHMSKQLESMGASFDWNRVVSTIDPEYYRWTQWMFVKMYEKGLAYRAKTHVNWCPKDKTVLANEQVVGGLCDRCDSAVEQKEVEQWMFKITGYADRLVDDLEGLDWPETTKIAQKNWIGRSRGALITFSLLNIPGQEDGKHTVQVFTTRPDTIYGATFLVISPELAQKWLEVGWQASSEVKEYIEKSLAKRELERLEQKDKTGIFTGLSALNPASQEKIPVWIADYVIGSYGTGAIMAVPAHDERDGEFAQKFNLPVSDAPLHDAEEVVEMLQQKGIGQPKTNYRLRDWVLSRQRYWGVPIPMIHCPECGYQPVPEAELPVKLPKLDDFLPTDDGRSPLAKAESWVKTVCPKCDKEAQRETDTMDTFVDSSWYYLRYTDPQNAKEFATKENMAQWLPVPMYVGGAEHNTMHLLYARFFAKVLYDLGYTTSNEPFTTRVNHGTVLGPDGQKMSKSRGNVVDPDAEVEKYGADTVRMFLAFMAPYDQGGPWDPKGIHGVSRFLNRVWYFVHRYNDAKASEISTEATSLLLNRAIKNISRDLDALHFNTGVSELMKLLNGLENELGETGKLSSSDYEILLQLLAPFAPHVAEELWRGVLSKSDSIHCSLWPTYDESILAAEMIEIPVQVNRKVRGTIRVAKDLSEKELEEQARSAEGIQKHLEGKNIQRVIVVVNRMVNFVVS